MPFAERPRAAIFDLDGTIVDNMCAARRGVRGVRRAPRLPALTPADRAKLDGRRNSEIFPVLFGREMSREEWLAYEHEKEGLYRELSRGRLTLVAGLPALLERLEDQRHRRGAGHLGARAERRTHAERGRPGRRLRHVVRGDQVPRGKPAPDVFLEASRQLDVPPEWLRRVRGRADGHRRGEAAGMRVVAVTTSFSAAQFNALADPPDLVCADFEAVLALADW